MTRPLSTSKHVAAIKAARLAAILAAREAAKRA